MPKPVVRALERRLYIRVRTDQHPITVETGSEGTTLHVHNHTFPVPLGYWWTDTLATMSRPDDWRLHRLVMPRSLFIGVVEQDQIDPLIRAAMTALADALADQSQGPGWIDVIEAKATLHPSLVWGSGPRTNDYHRGVDHWNEHGWQRITDALIDC